MKARQRMPWAPSWQAVAGSGRARRALLLACLFVDVLTLCGRWAAAETDSEAVDRFRTAAAAGNTGAQFNLGIMYMSGRGVEQDDTEAFGWFRKAAEQGDAEGQINLGAMYSDGRGVQQSVVEAVKWYVNSDVESDVDSDT